MAQTLDKPPPLYATVKAYIRQNIAEGAWAPGARIPSEADLVARLGVSRMTANRALRELRDQGELTRVQGVGSFVPETRPAHALLEIRDIAAEIAARGASHAARVLTLTDVDATPDLARRFEMRAGARLYHSRIVHSADGVPVQLETRFVNPAVAPDYLMQDFTQTTPHDHLIAAAAILEVEHAVAAVPAESEAAALLHVAPGTPCLKLDRVTWSPGGGGATVVATVNTFLHPGDRHILRSRYAPGAASASLGGAEGNNGAAGPVTVSPSSTAAAAAMSGANQRSRS